MTADEALPAGPTILHLDLRGLHCPLPVLRARKALRHLAVGEAVVLDCTDPLSLIDVPHFAAQSGHTVSVETTEDGVHRFRLVRGR